MRKLLFIVISALIIAILLIKFVYIQNEEQVVEISTIAPNETISVYISKDISLNDEINLEQGYIVSGKLTEINISEDNDNNSSFILIPESYTDLNGATHQVPTEIRITYSEKAGSDNDSSEIAVGTKLFYPSSIEDTQIPLATEEEENSNN